MKRGRRSAASNVISFGLPNSRPKITPLRRLSPVERRVFDHALRENGHLKRADAAMLEIYSIAHARTIAAKRKGPEAWEKEARTMMALARTLRLTVQSTQEPRTVARRRAEAESSGPKPWDDDGFGIR